MGLSGGGCTDYKAGSVRLCFAFCFEDSNPAPAVLPISVKEAEVVPIGGKGGAGFRQAWEGKPIANLYPVRNGGNIHAGGDRDRSGGGVRLRKGKGKVVIPGKLASGKGKGTA